MNNLKRSLALCTGLWMGGCALQAQSTPEMQEILSRLDKLEQANRDLTRQVQELGKELAAARGENQAPQTPSVEDQVAVDQARIAEMAQSKVESSQKLPIRVTGTALFNAYVNGALNGGIENPVIASLTSGDATGGGTLRQTTVGLQYESPRTIFGAKASGSVFADFFGGSANSLDHLVRLRTASVSLDWKNTSLLFGQEKPIISPRDPDSYAQVGVSPLT
ncbi:MAG: hypothetical protein ACRD30_06110, partial [Bryobacteraceae bacterium]